MPDYLIALVVAVVVAVIVTAAVALVFRMLGRRRYWARALVRLLRVPFRILILVTTVWIATAVFLEASRQLDGLLDFVFGLLFVGSAAWLICAALYFVEDVVSKRYRVDVSDNRVARRVRTQLRMLRRIGVVVVIICALATLLLQIPGAAAAGASLFASAGLVSVVAALAAQSTLANVFAGMQLAFNNALRVDDVVIVDDLWGRIEEITLTYVVVHIWDDRRMVVPSTYFTTTPFQNWTKYNSELLGAVEFDVDWRVRPAQMREELGRIVAQTELWDGRTAVLQLTDAVGGYVRVRVLVSAADAGKLFDLRCVVRENLIEWLNSDNPEALPLGRVELHQPAAPTDAANGSRKQHPVTEAPGVFSGDADAEQRGAQFTEAIPVQQSGERSGQP